MGFVFADSQSWLREPGLAPFEVVPLQTFKRLREAVNDGNTADFFMWEHFTSKRYYDNESIKKIGEIYTPWPSWKVVAKDDVRDATLQEFFKKLNQGVEYFEGHQDEAVKYISTELDYSEGDAREWLGTVRFAKDVEGVKMETVQKTVKVLKKAGVLEGDISIEAMVGRTPETKIE